MNKSTVFVSSISLLFMLCVFHILTWRQLEIIEAISFSTYRTTSFALFGFVLILLVVSAPNDYSGMFGRTLAIITTLCTGLLWVTLVTFYPFPQARKDAKTLYVNKQDSNRKIIVQVTFAGALGSDRYDTIIVKQLIKNIRWREEVDASEINQKEWRRLKSN